MGAYSSSTAYFQGDIVTYGGSTWIASQNSTGQTPAADSYWTLLGVLSAGSGGGGTSAFSGLTGTGTTHGRIVYQQSTWANLGDFAIDTANVAASVSNGLITISGTAGNLGGYLALNATQCADEAVDLEVLFTVNGTPGAAQTYGISVGKVSQDTQAPDHIAGFLALDDSPVDIKWMTGSGTSVAAPGTSVTVGTVASGDLIRLVYAQRGTTYTLVYDNYTQGTHATNTVQGALATPYGVTAPNTAKLGIWCQGGSYTIQNIRAISRQPDTPNVAYVGDSKTWGFNAVTPMQRFASLNDRFGPVAVFAGQADETAQCLGNVPYIVASRPKQVVLCIGYNDIGFGVATATWQANYGNIVAGLQNGGATVFHLLLPPTPQTNSSALNNYVQANYPSGNIINVTTVALSSDNVHPSSVGHAQIAAAIASSGVLTAAGGASISQPLAAAMQYSNSGNAGASAAAASTGGATVGLAQQQAFSASGAIPSGISIAFVTATATMTLPSPTLQNVSGATPGADVRVVSLVMSPTPVTVTVQPPGNGALTIGGAAAPNFVVASGYTAIFSSSGLASGGGPSYFLSSYAPNTGTAAATTAAQSITQGLSYVKAYSASGTIDNGIALAGITTTSTQTLPNPPGLTASGSLAAHIKVVSLRTSSTAVTVTVQPGSNASLYVAGVPSNSFVIADGYVGEFASFGITPNGGPSWFMVAYYLAT